jgi:release factor glutamine methyltransferase
MNSTAFRPPGKISIDKHFSVSDWLYVIRQEHPELSGEASNTIWVLLSHVLDQPKSWLMAHTEFQLESRQKTILDTLFSRLMMGIPLAYLINHWSFFGLDFYVNESVLIPRPETELLVEKAFSWLQMNLHAKTMADVGTGSGCIAITIAKTFPQLEIVASDISISALQVAQINIRTYTISNINLVECDLLTGMKKKFDLICANLPYIPTQTLNSLAVSKHEPRIALDGGENGLMQIERLLNQAVNLLQEKGALLIEFESTQEKEILKSTKDIFPAAELAVFEDLAKKPRMLMIQSK